MRIIFMGTPDFAVPSLEILVNNNYEVVAVVTAPDKPKGRGLQVVPSPVKEKALEHNIPVLQPTSLKSPEFIETLKQLNADLHIVVAFRMLPVQVWSMPPSGTFNLHASLLPQYRGAAPINWAIINGEKETGLTTFFLKHEIDTGDIIFQEKELINENDNVASLYERLKTKGAGLVLKTVKAIENKDFTLFSQSSENIKTAPKIFKETCEIDWNKTFSQINDFIRGLSPYPASWAVINGRTYKIRKISKQEDQKPHLQPGEFETDNKNFLAVKVADGAAFIEELQPEGKKTMTIQEFLRGHKI